MPAFLGALLVNLLGTAMARVLTGAGLAVVTFAALYPLVDSTLTALRNSMGGLPSALLALIQISGLGTVLSMFGSAVLTRVAITAATVGIKKAASS